MLKIKKVFTWDKRGNGLLIHHFFWENFLRGIVKKFFNFLWDFFGALFSKNFNLYLLFWVMNEWFRYSNDDDVRRIAGLEWRRFSKKYGTRMTTILKEIRDSNDDEKDVQMKKTFKPRRRSSNQEEEVQTKKKKFKQRRRSSNKEEDVQTKKKKFEQRRRSSNKEEE